MHDRVGQELGNYRLERLLGRGGAAEVYLGVHLHLHSQAAIKIMNPHLAQEDVERFHWEAQTVASLAHPHIVRVFDFDVENGVAFLVMDYAPNGSLRSRFPRGARVPLPLVVSYISQAASALQYAHARKLVHRDVKPENMLLNQHDTLLLSDFGIATFAHDTNSLDAQTAAGTIPYIAPEQIQEHPRPASDQYSLAVVAYEWLCGERPFQGSLSEIIAKAMVSAPPSLCERMPELPREVEQVIFTALAKDYKQRFANVNAFANALSQAAGETIAAIEKPFVTRPLPLGATWPSTPSQGTLPLASQTPNLQKQTQLAPANPLGPVPSTSPPTVSPAITGAPLQTEDVSNAHSLKRVSKKFALLLVSFVLLLISAGLGTWYISNSSNQAHQYAMATATALAGTTATASTVLTAYDRNTARGIMLGFDAAHTGLNPYEHQLNPTDVSRLTLAWSAAMGGPVTDGGVFVSSPIVADEMVYVGSFDGTLYAFHAGGCGTGKSTCTPVWSASIGKIFPSVAVANGVLYVGTSRNTFYAFKANGCGKAVCAPLWSAHAKFTIISSLTVADGMVYFGSDDNSLYAFHAQGCGKPVCMPAWTASTGSHIVSTPAVADGVLYVGSQDHQLYVFNADGCGSQPVCQPLWTATTGGEIRSSPAVVDGTVYIGSDDGKLYAFPAGGCAAATCQPLWTATTGSYIRSSPAIANGIVYIGSGDGSLYAYKASGCQATSCAPIWKATTGGEIVSVPFIANGVVYTSSTDHKLYAFDAAGCGGATTCRPLWTFTADSPLHATPIVANGMLYITSFNSTLYAFHEPG